MLYSDKQEKEADMKRLMLLFLVVAAFGANSVMTSGIAINTHPQPAQSEFYWDDGILSSGWIWFTGGNYWAVQFDEVKTGGAVGVLQSYGAVAYSGWPDSTFQGCYMHTFDDLGGYPGAELDSTYLGFTTGGVFEWVSKTVWIDNDVFYVAFQQIGNYPQADAVGVDAVAGTHDWTGYQGSWAPTTSFGDFMIRCYWGAYDGVEETSWGAVKALY
jgi:hypothetical protein